MKKVLFAVTVLLLLILPIASAINTEIKVKTMPFHEVQLTTYNSNTEAFDAFERFKGEADKYGDITFTAISDESAFNIIIYIKWNGATVVSKRYEEGYTAGEPIYIEIARPGFQFIETPEETGEEPPENETRNDTVTDEETETQQEDIQEEQQTTEESNQDDSEITGLSIFEKVGEGLSSKTLWLIVIILVVVAVILFFMKKASSMQMFSKTPLLKTNNEGSAGGQELRRAERRIAEAQAEINRIKNKERIRDAEKRLATDMESLRRLKRGE